MANLASPQGSVSACAFALLAVEEAECFRGTVLVGFSWHSVRSSAVTTNPLVAHKPYGYRSGRSRDESSG